MAGAGRRGPGKLLLEIRVLKALVERQRPGRTEAVARVYLGAHNPLDVVCGTGAGLVLGAVLTMVLGTGRRPDRA